jgi:hypothetical protein
MTAQFHGTIVIKIQDPILSSREIMHSQTYPESNQGNTFHTQKTIKPKYSQIKVLKYDSLIHQEYRMRLQLASIQL